MPLEEQLQHNDAEWSQLDARRGLQSSACLLIGGSTQDSQAHMKPSSAGNGQHAVHSNKAGAVQPTLRVHTGSGKPNVQTAIQVKCSDSIVSPMQVDHACHYFLEVPLCWLARHPQHQKPVCEMCGLT